MKGRKTPKRHPKFKYRLALDVGTSSLGWCIYRLHPVTMEPVALVRPGVRLFSSGRDGKTQKSLAESARQQRSMRRTLRRKASRRRRFAAFLTEAGLLPTDQELRLALNKLDPYELRARALDAPLTREELGRAIYHLARKRGFQSNRKDRRGGDEGGSYKAAIERLQAALEVAGVKTVGQYLARLHAAGTGVRMRSIPAKEIAAIGGEVTEVAGDAEASREVAAATPGDGAPELGLDDGHPQMDLFAPLRRLVAEVRPEAVRGAERPGKKPAAPGKLEHLYFLDRAMVHTELVAIFRAQREFHPELLTDELYRMMLAEIDYRRGLHPAERGTCPYHPDEPREPLASPLQRRFRIYQEVGNIRIVSPDGAARRLTRAQWRDLVDHLLRHPEISMVGIRKRLGLVKGGGESLNFEAGDKPRKKLVGDPIGCDLMKWVGQAWLGWPAEERDGIATQEGLVALLLDNELSDPQLLDALQAAPWGLSAAQANGVIAVALPDGVGRLGRTALRNILAAYEQSEDVPTYNEAVELAGYQSHSDFHTGEIMDRLPYYGACDLVRSRWCMRIPLARHNASFNGDERNYGRIMNPTVHLALNQLRKVVNAIIDRYGRPDEIVVEMAREVGMSGKDLKEHQRRQAENEAENEAIRAELVSLAAEGKASIRIGSKAIERQRLWREAGRNGGECVCPYSGAPITAAMLHTEQVHVDHILPRSETHDDGIANKILCVARANASKGDKAPYEAFGHLPEWDAIVARVRRMYPRGSRAKRFAPDAMQVFEAERNFHASQLGLTGYFARAALTYLTYVCPRDRVWGTNGKYTSLLRKELGLADLLAPREGGRKNRDDHRHHALDAAVIGLCDRKLLPKISAAYRRIEDEQRRGKKGERVQLIEAPWSRFRHDLEEALARVIVSRKPEHGIEGEVNQSTHYRVAEHRRNKATGAHEPWGVAKGGDGKAVRLRPVRAHKTHDGRPQFITTNSNHCFDIWQTPSGKWAGGVVSTMDAYAAQRAGADTRRAIAPPGCTPIMRLHKGDVLRIDARAPGATHRVVVVQKFSDGKIAIYDHHEANCAARNNQRIKSNEGKAVSMSPARFLTEECFASSGLQKLNAQLLSIDPLGNSRIAHPRSPRA